MHKIREEKDYICWAPGEVALVGTYAAYSAEDAVTAFAKEHEWHTQIYVAEINHLRVFNVEEETRLVAVELEGRDAF